MGELRPTLELIGGLIAIIALVVSAVQLAQSRKATLLSNRSYVSVRYEISRRLDKADAVLLVFENHGRAIARNISLNFGGKTGWEYIQKPEDLPFIGDSKIHELLPGMSLRYFVGDLSPKSTLVSLKDSSVTAMLSYKDDMTGREQSHEVALTLRHLKYATKHA